MTADNGGHPSLWVSPSHQTRNWNDSVPQTKHDMGSTQPWNLKPNTRIYYQRRSTWYMARISVVLPYTPRWFCVAAVLQHIYHSVKVSCATSGDYWSKILMFRSWYICVWLIKENMKRVYCYPGPDRSPSVRANRGPMQAGMYVYILFLTVPNQIKLLIKSTRRVVLVIRNSGMRKLV